MVGDVAMTSFDVTVRTAQSVSFAMIFAPHECRISLQTRESATGMPRESSWHAPCFAHDRAERLGFRPRSSGAGPRDATARMLEASGGTRRAKIPGEHCTGLLARTSSRLRAPRTPTKVRTQSGSRPRGTQCFASWPDSSLPPSLALPVTSAADAAPKKDFKVCWSIYVGWMPWGYLSDSGIMKKWADKYGITVEIARSTTMSRASTSTRPAASTAAR